ncbi:MAG: hydroxyacid dehydrogenase [Filomicrobium sp.]
MSRIVISEFMDTAAIEKLRADHDVVVDETLCENTDALAETIAEADALIVRNRTQVTAELISSATKLKAVGRLGVGLDNIDLQACKARDIAVLPAVGANAVSVAEYVLTTAMMLLRGPVYFRTSDLQNGKWPRPELSKGREIAGKTMGLVGFGSIGQTTANLARAAGFNTIAYDTFLPADHDAWKTTASKSLDELLREAEVISLHCPLTPETTNLIGKDELAKLKPGTVLINTARGGIVDERALANSLRSGHLGGAAVDVFSSEPIDEATAEVFSDVPNLVLTPHVAGVTAESNTRISAITAENVLRTLREKQS